LADKVASLHTVVKNISGTRRYFGFLPPHGRWLNANETRAIPGNIINSLATTDEARGSERNIKALKSAIRNDLLQIRMTPALILQSGDHTLVKQLALDNNGDLILIDPGAIDSDSYSDPV